MKAILITSDDFGMALAVNQGIEEALRFGIVGATNLMVPCPWFSDAVKRVRQNHFSTGIHMTLTCEWDSYRWRPLTSSPHLRAEDGCMHRSFEQIPLAITAEEIRREFDAQLLELRRCGIEPTHVDTHMIASASDSPMELRVKEVVMSLCRDEKLIYTYETSSDGRLKYFDSEILASPLSATELRDAIASRGEGIHHVITHCGVAGLELAQLSSMSDPWALEYRVKDHALLTGLEFRSFLEQQGFRILSMKEFIKSAHVFHCSRVPSLPSNG